MNKTNKSFSLITFFCLYIAQMVPSSFLMTALQVIMREGHYSLTTIGLLNLVRLPWLLKLFWSPLIDRNCITIAHYKRTIIITESVYALALVITSLINVQSNLLLILILVFISLLASATQDIATDALAIITSVKRERSMLNSMQSMGSFGGALLGSGVLLIVLKNYGWLTVVLCLAFFVIIMLIPLLLNKGMKAKTPKPSQKATFGDILYFFSFMDNWRQVGFLLLYYMGLIGIISMLRPYMVDCGYDIKQIGFYIGVLGTFCSFVMAFVAGFIIKYIGILYTRFIVALAICLAPVYFFIINLLPFNHIALIIGIVYVQICYGLATVVVYTSAMQCVRHGREGTDFTIQIVITHLSGIIIAAVAGFVAHHLNYSGLFAVEIFISVVSVLYILRFFKNKTKYHII